jgi:hypothetical protein
VAFLMVAEKNTLYAKRIHGRGKALAMTPKKPRKTRHPSSKRNQTSDLRYPSLWQNPTADNALRILEQAVAVVGHGLAIADATQADYPLVYVNETFCALTG